jgi:Kyakuja-Dileera-Zisupton transposase
MDFIAWSSLVGVMVLLLSFSYDIACQWSRNLKRRVGQLPSWMQPPPALVESLKFVIPKFHIYGHGSQCQTHFSLNFLRYSARTNGEEPEKWWAHINPVSMSTKEMGGGARHDTIDDHAAAWNWRKITNLGMITEMIFNWMLIAMYLL